MAKKKKDDPEYFFFKVAILGKFDGADSGKITFSQLQNIEKFTAKQLKDMIKQLDEET